ncbi:hypothetical protein Nepgr_007837 [Nepenthes gracilis]|uniref:Uncharacterized protein n=1 Tax=Nepenthes gracilis TaxID=150966 RepID=A0AAD3XIM6_NEPGR|nr:hypothetical protein Nepgr_007837 [Nepenthes gracilis]
MVLCFVGWVDFVLNFAPTKLLLDVLRPVWLTDGARSRDATFAVLGKSHAEWLRMGLCCSGERCHADARWKR